MVEFTEGLITILSPYEMNGNYPYDLMVEFTEGLITILSPYEMNGKTTFADVWLQVTSSVAQCYMIDCIGDTGRCA